MSSIVTSILSSTVGLLWNKARDTTAKKLKDGDVTDAQIRQLVVRELEDIKGKLDGLSRKDLLSSYTFLQEGVDLLNISVNKSKLEPKSWLNEAQDDLSETSRMSSGGERSVFNEALELSQAMSKVKINSDKEFESAKERFKDARKRATDAFCNEALSIQERLFAAKVRIISEILECLECPETAITGCVSFLKKLHSLPEIREIFSVYLNRGVKALWNKAERVENVKAVMLINQVLFELNLKFSRNFTDRLCWPAGTIELDDRSFNPILDWQEVSTRKSIGNDLMQIPIRLILGETIAVPALSVVNGKGEIVLDDGHNKIKIISRTKESKVVKLLDPKEGKLLGQDMEALAVDKNNNVYVVTYLETRTENGLVRSDVLNVLDESYNVKHHCALGFLGEAMFGCIEIAVNRNNDIIIIKPYEGHVYVCDSSGQLKRKFGRDTESLALSLCISNKNVIIAESANSEVVNVYTEEGNLRSTINVPEGHEVGSVAFHHLLGKIIVLTYNKKEDSYFLICFSETNELETSTFFCKGTSVKCFPTITSHPSGPVAVVSNTSITFI